MSEPAKRFYRLNYTKRELVKIKTKRKIVGLLSKLRRAIFRSWSMLKRWCMEHVGWKLIRLRRGIVVKMRRKGKKGLK